MHVLSGFSAATALASRHAGESQLLVSLDLNRSHELAMVEMDGLRLPGGAIVDWATLERLARHENRCIAVDEDGTMRRLTVHSSATGRLASLYATESGAPTMILGGFPMHRIKGIDPWEDTRRKLAAAAPISGRVLDTATGLGYTSIACAERGATVTTIELDPGVLELARDNPWSAPLFDNPKITSLQGSALDVVPELPERAFELIVHDPPTLALAPPLYAEPFYRALHARLSSRGRLFHYIGSPDSRQGASLTRNVLRRLKDAGFSSAKAAPDAFGIVAQR